MLKTPEELAGSPRVRTAHLTLQPATYYDVLEARNDSGKPPVVMVHGGAHDGTCYQSTADGQPGWAQVFADRGYRVVVPDWPGVSRSGPIPYAELTSAVVVAGLGRVLEALDRPAIVLTHSMGGTLGWKLLELHGDRIDRLVAVAPGPPGNIEPPTVFLSEDDDSVTLQGVPGGPVIRVSRHEPFIGPREWVEQKLIGNGGRFPAEQVQRYIDSRLGVPPRLLLERLNYRGSSPKVTDFSSYAEKRILVLSATHDAEHTEALDRPVAEWLNQHGAHADYIYLGDRSIVGNGHMMMVERNSDEIAALIIDWLERG